MFIRLRENSESVLAVNLKICDTILIVKKGDEFALTLETDASITPTTGVAIEYYGSHQRAIQAFENMMDMLGKGHHLCDVSEF